MLLTINGKGDVGENMDEEIIIKRLINIRVV